MLRPGDKIFEVSRLDVIIPAGASQPIAGVDLQGLHLAALLMPSGWDAASITLQTSFDDISYANVYDNTGTEFAIVVAASRHVTLDLTRMIALGNFLKIRSGTSGAPVNQTVARTISLIPRSF